MATQQSYYVPEQSKWPIIATVGLFLTLSGLATVMVNKSGGDTSTGWWMFGIGSLVMVYMLFGWFGNVAKESMAGLYSAQMDRSFRWGMSWFIFSEVMFFSAFFGALFYVRYLAVPWLAGEGDGAMNTLLWSDFEGTWPLMSNPDPKAFPGPDAVINPWSIPLLNTVLLLTSSVTITFAHHAIKKDEREKVKLWLGLTILLGAIFLGFQVYEYIEAYHELNLTLASGIYGTTFFMLTGFHGMHVTLGAIILTVIMLRYMKGHFSAKQHFGFEAAAWYWHFVDVVWVCLFVLVYIM
ncbi:cytochrome-c oxidase, subnunit III [Hahella chejuensis KCTC 2396]|uniref:cytochrome-c oxidase n=1 Tax=Hahella chejuensis (strain KCTC 2396) TaxID=349521 RepID=Q2SQV3_HAHCH|nr:cytochrome c oxidase subunit 3 [Hahella chejuensis]ABC26971.1 cytochrome-c oxidase, subnunit III [Hahella chejuensis KCTC 2396]